MVKNLKIISGFFVAVGVIIAAAHVGHAGERVVPSVPHNVICEMSGYDLGTSQNKGCTALLDTFPIRHYPLTFQHAVVRSIDMGKWESNCSMVGNVNQPVRCTRPAALPIRLLPKQLDGANK